MIVPVTSLLEMTNLIKEGSVEIMVGKSSIRIERDVICLDICNTSPTIFQREDILTQIKQLSQLFCDAGKRLVIKYNHSTLLTLGAGTDSVVLQLLGMDHVTIGNPFTVFRLLRKWGENYSEG